MEKASIPMRSSSEFSNTLAAPMASEIDELADRSEGLEQRIASLNETYETLKKGEVELIERRWVLIQAGGFFDRVIAPSIVTTSSYLALLADIGNRLMATPRKFDNP